MILRRVACCLMLDLRSMKGVFGVISHHFNIFINYEYRSSQCTWCRLFSIFMQGIIYYILYLVNWVCCMQCVVSVYTAVKMLSSPCDMLCSEFWVQSTQIRYMYLVPGTVGRCADKLLPYHTAVSSTGRNLCTVLCSSCLGVHEVLNYLCVLAE